MKSRNLAPLLIILIVIVLAVFGPKIKGFLDQRDSLTLLKEAPKGTLAEGLPQSLVLAPDARIVSSGMYQDQDEMNVLVAEYSTKASLGSLFAAYVSYFTNQGFVLTKTETKGDTSSILATKPGQVVSVDISLSDAGDREARLEVRDTIK